MPMKLYIGDILLLKKEHPCGGAEWEVLRTGMDFRIKCRKCGHSVMIARVKLEKDIKRVVKSMGSTLNNVTAQAEDNN
ncbi:MAG: DUF951 domain-containing protein [Firmicutes bacterium]|nr:DUF951 domain-containing protein [Dethiobacter sp.]MBS3888856.1 DUF951 domain-containing protein [Bacillota bacterium]MBS4054939.1 DUF951 domain-containing protein [Thermaerobacter sp.]